MPREHVLVAIMILALAGASVASGGSLIILDGSFDPVLMPNGIGIPEPSIDLRATRVFGDGSRLHIEWEVEDLDFEVASTHAQWRGYALIFGSERHNEVRMIASHFPEWDIWFVDVWCADAAGSTTCFETLHPDSLTTHGDIVTIRVPYEVTGKHVLHAQSMAVADYEGIPWTNAGMFDLAPDCVLLSCPRAPDYYAP